MNRLLPATAMAFVFLITSAAHAAEQTVTLKVGNLYCASCPYIVKKTLAAIPGVKTVNVSFKEKTAVVIFDDNQTNVAALIDATSNMGFPSKELNR